MKKENLDNFFNTEVIPELSCFARDYGFLKEYKLYIKYVDGDEKNVTSEVSHFVRLFNKRNEGRLWFYGGELFFFKLSLEGPDHISVLYPNPNTELILLNHNLEEYRLTSKILWLGVAVALVLTSGTNYFFIGLSFILLYFFLMTLGRKIAAKFGVFL